jgi:hypothetical protein
MIQEFKEDENYTESKPFTKASQNLRFFQNLSSSREANASFLNAIIKIVKYCFD